MCNKLLTLIAVCVIASLLALPAFAAKEIFHETYDVNSGTVLEVHNIDGSVTVSGGMSAAVDVYAEKISHPGGKLENVKIEVTIGEIMTIRTVHLVRNPRVSVRYKITVPDGIHVKEVTSSDGSLTIDGTQGDLLAKTSDGSVRVTNIAGNVDMKTSDGSITGENITGTVDAKTSDGSITLKNITGNTTAKTSDGSITIEEIQGEVIADTRDGSVHLLRIAGFVDAKTSDGSIKAEDVSGILGLRTSDGSIVADVRGIREDVTIKTGDGSINLSLALDVNADVAMKTSDGKILLHDIEIKATEVSNTRIKGTIGDGGRTLEVETSNGNIDVYALP